MGGLLRKPALSGTEPARPLLRGQFHHFAFYVHLLLGAVILSMAKSVEAQVSFFIYLVSMLVLYGTSATLHTTDWTDPENELKVQKLDHACIFLLISGTYTAVCVLFLPLAELWVWYILGAVWITAISGVIKTIYWHDPPVVVNVAFYFFTGLIIVPFFPKVVTRIDWISAASFVAGGVFYLTGGVVYGLQAPDPFPEVFGYHEIFHVLTVMANSCFLLPIIMKIAS